MTFLLPKASNLIIELTLQNEGIFSRVFEKDGRQQTKLKKLSVYPANSHFSKYLQFFSDSKRIKKLKHKGYKIVQILESDQELSLAKHVKACQKCANPSSSSTERGLQSSQTYSCTSYLRQTVWTNMRTQIHLHYCHKPK